jgi:hypothetical protein
VRAFRVSQFQNDQAPLQKRLVPGRHAILKKPMEHEQAQFRHFPCCASVNGTKNAIVIGQTRCLLQLRPNLFVRNFGAQLFPSAGV